MSHHLRDTLLAISHYLAAFSLEIAIAFLIGWFIPEIDPWLSTSSFAPHIPWVLNATSSLREWDQLLLQRLAFEISYGVLSTLSLTLLRNTFGLPIVLGYSWVVSKLTKPTVKWLAGEWPDAEYMSSVQDCFFSLICFTLSVLLRSYHGLLGEIAVSSWFWTRLASFTGACMVLKHVPTTRPWVFVPLRFVARQIFLLCAAARKTATQMLSYASEFEQNITDARDAELLAGSPFYHQPLAADHIRLIRIKRRLPFAGLRCELEQHRLDSCPPYEAISYCWGKSQPSKSVIIDGRPFKVLDAVFDILHYRYSWWTEHLLWIDSICIRQCRCECNKEKQVQIPLMGKIFRGAVRVLGWLGEHEDPHSALGLLAKLRLRELDSQEYRGESLIEFYQEPGRGWPHLSKLLCNPWFRRAWVIQEVALAQKLHIVIGGICLDWSGISELPKSLDYLRMLLDCGGYSGSQAMLGAEAISLLNVNRVRTVIGYNLSQTVPLAECLEYSIAAEATEPHDKVYAILGIADCPPDEPLLRPQYTLPVATVYTQTMRYFLTTSHPLSLLHWAGIGWQRNYDLPSWVPDLSKRNFFPWHKANEHRFKAATARPSKVRDLASSNSWIQVLCNSFDTIDELSPVTSIAPGREDTTSPIFEPLRIWLKTVWDMARQHPKLSDPALLEERFWRTLIADPGGESQRRPSLEVLKRQYSLLKVKLGFDLPQVDGITMNDDDADELFAEIQPLMMCMKDGIVGKRVALTKEGYLAVVPPGSKPGDVLVLIWGAEMPYLARKKRTVAGLCYELVGCSYVHGIMDGAFADDKRLESDAKMITLV